MQQAPTVSLVGPISEKVQPSANSSGRREELCTMHLLLFGTCCFFGGDNRMLEYAFIITQSFMNLSSALSKTLTSTANAQSLYFNSDYTSTQSGIEMQMCMTVKNHNCANKKMYQITTSTQNTTSTIHRSIFSVLQQCNHKSQVTQSPNATHMPYQKPLILKINHNNSWKQQIKHSLRIRTIPATK